MTLEGSVVTSWNTMGACRISDSDRRGRYKDYLKDNAQGIYDQELADFLAQLGDETSRRAKRAEDLLAQRLADGGVH